jgi:hypothetical protein
MINRVNQNNQLFSKSFFDNKQINHFLWNWHEKKIIFRSSSSNRDNELRYETQINHEMKKACSQIVLRCARRNEKNHIYRMLRFNEIIYRVSSVIWIKKKREESFFVEISNKASTKRSIFESIEFSTKRQVIESNSIIILMFSSQLNQSIVIVSLTSTLFTAEFNTSSTESISSISILSVLKRYLELRYRFDFFDFLNLLIMRCMKNVIDFQQTLKSRSYKKTINDSNRDEWLKIMKNENKFLLINEIWTLINFFKDRRVLRDKWIYKIKKNEHDEILRYKARWMIRDFEQIERLNYTKTFVSMIKSMSYKTMYVIIVVNDWEIE